MLEVRWKLWERCTYMFFMRPQLHISCPSLWNPSMQDLQDSFRYKIFFPGRLLHVSCSQPWTSFKQSPFFALDLRTTETWEFTLVISQCKPYLDETWLNRVGMDWAKRVGRCLRFSSGGIPSDIWCLWHMAKPGRFPNPCVSGPRMVKSSRYVRRQGQGTMLKLVLTRLKMIKQNTLGGTRWKSLQNDFAWVKEYKMTLF